MDAFKAWWVQATSRDQLAVVICGVCVSVYILFMMVLKPVQEMRRAEQIKNNALRGSLENVRVLASQVAAQKGDEGGSNRNSIESIVQQTVSTHRLQVASMNASGNTGVRLRFDEAPFENVLKWLYEMEIDYDLKIKDLSVASASTSGMVSVNLRLHQG